jgi:hypothetical protein
MTQTNLILIRESSSQSASGTQGRDEMLLGGGDLASNPAVLQVNLRHCRSSPSSDMVGRWIGDGLAARREGRVRVVWRVTRMVIDREP